MDPITALVLTGLTAGLVHVVSGADHLAALMPLSVGKRWRAGLLGIRWGVGHTAGVVVVALIAVALKQRLDVAGLLGVWAESLVGLMLIVIGAYGIRRAMRYDVHAHPHSHNGDGHAHLHAHGVDDGGSEGSEQDSAGATEEVRAVRSTPERDHHFAHQHTAFLAGILHGVAGTSHFLGVLPAVALPTWLHSGTYLAAYGLGSIVAMGAFASLVGAATSRGGVESPRLIRSALYATSGVAIAVGVAWIILPAVGSL